MEINQILEYGESKLVEFKEKYTKDIYKSVIAFSNTAGGRIFIGINDQRQVVGIDGTIDIFELQDSIISNIHDHCHPMIMPEVYMLNIGLKVICVVSVVKGQFLPYYDKNESKDNSTYVRMGATNRKASLEMIQELERQRNNIGYDEMIDYKATLDHYDLQPLIDAFLKIGKKIELVDMINLKLVIEENNQHYPSHALMILLGKLDHVKIQCALFKGINREMFLDRKEFSGDLFSQIEKAEAFIKQHIKLNGRFEGMRRIDEYELPPIAFKEAIMNAIVHRDYSRTGSDVKIALYDDRLSIVSPGQFMTNGYPIDLTSGRSEIRNKVIARVFKELGYVEIWGSGLPIMLSTCLDKGLKRPVIEEKGGFVDVQIFRMKEETISELTYDDLTIQEETVMKYLNANDHLKSSDFTEVLKVKDRRVRIILKGLVDKGYIENIGHTTNSIYRLTKQK